ncbi:uncharacterized protein [Euphorbia lathyris]|uniref:uncharacterized protein n=1 Tax=Euphorbia lathyris TaxID=212925 RepID=UPI003313752D
MDGIDSFPPPPFWTYQQVWQKLLDTTTELETLKIESQEQLRKHRDDVKHLIELINVSNKERDELKFILTKLIPHETPNVLLPINSSITESNSHNSHNSSPVDSFFDAASSPDSNFSEFQPISNVIMDPIECIARGRALPKKGKLLDAITEAGPLLQTLLVAAPLPQWRNPPPMQTFSMPPVSISGGETSSLNNAGAPRRSNFDSSQPSSSSSVLNFTKRHRSH